MKKHLVFIVLTIFITGCCKDSEDFRDRYVGDYKCYYLKTSYYLNDSGEAFNDTLNFSRDTMVLLQKVGVKNKIIFLDWYLYIYENGSVDSGYCYLANCIDHCNYFDLRFENDSIYFNTRCGGLGFGYNYALKGVKK